MKALKLSRDVEGFVDVWRINGYPPAFVVRTSEEGRPQGASLADLMGVYRGGKRDSALVRLGLPAPR